MICNNCTRTIKEPLVLYDGRLICPSCNKPIIVSNAVFKITDESDELYKQSEILFLAILPKLNTTDANEFNKKKSELNKTFAKIFTLCNKAAVLGHPRAVWRLGYYYEKRFIDPELPEDYRLKIAYQYYSSLIKNEQSEFEDVKLDAALRINDMLSSFSAGKKTSVMFDYEKNYADLYQRFGDRIPKYDVVQEGSISGIIDVVKTYANTGNKTPILGIFKVKISELKEIIKALARSVGGARSNDDGTETYSLDKVRKQVELYYYDDGKRIGIGSSDSINNILEITEDKDILFHYQLRGRETKFQTEIYDFIRKNNKELHINNFELMVKVDAYFVFSKDDVNFMKKNKIGVSEYLEDAIKM